MRACRLARLAQGVRRPASGMGRVPPSSHGAPCALSARRVLPVPAGRAPMPPAPHRLPAGWPVPRSKSQPAGRLEGLLRRGGRRHASARSAPVPARERGPGRGGRSAGHSGRSCTPVRKILHAWSSGAGAQRQGTSGRPPKRPACLTCSKNSAKHGRRCATGGWRHLGKRVGPACARRRRTLPAVAARKSTMLQRGTSPRHRADGRRRTDGQTDRRPAGQTDRRVRDRLFHTPRVADVSETVAGATQQTPSPCRRSRTEGRTRRGEAGMPRWRPLLRRRRAAKRQERLPAPLPGALAHDAPPLEKLSDMLQHVPEQILPAARLLEHHLHEAQLGMTPSIQPFPGRRAHGRNRPAGTSRLRQIHPRRAYCQPARRRTQGRACGSGLADPGLPAGALILPVPAEGAHAPVEHPSVAAYLSCRA